MRARMPSSRRSLTFSCESSGMGSQQGNRPTANGGVLHTFLARPTNNSRLQPCSLMRVEGSCTISATNTSFAVRIGYEILLPPYWRPSTPFGIEVSLSWVVLFPCGTKSTCTPAPYGDKRDRYPQSPSDKHGGLSIAHRTCKRTSSMRLYGRMCQAARLNKLSQNCYSPAQMLREGKIQRLDAI